MSSFLLTKQTASLAVEMSLPTLDTWLQWGYIDHTNIVVVVLDPTITQKAGYEFQEAVLHTAEHGDPKAKYKRVALSKAEVSWETGLPSHVAQQIYPHLYRMGYTKWGGSAVYYGIVVSCSGLSWQWDWAFSSIVAANIHALCIGGMRAMLESEMTFFGE